MTQVGYPHEKKHCPLPTVISSNVELNPILGGTDSDAINIFLKEMGRPSHHSESHFISIPETRESARDDIHDNKDPRQREPMIRGGSSNGVSFPKD
ncbi:hypothetical protein BASA83_001445 [Batrachochytrium salamandrivorans]|nr:hypothetical protein BASA83_001445 [Batrachochytrium salamandrivorans]